VLAEAGIGSRRQCDQLVAEGRVEVDGQIAVPGQRVDPATAVIRVDGDRIVTAADKSYLALNKPAGVITTMSDPQGRECVGDYLPERGARLFHVGRLDTETEGLLLLTNDGDLAHRLMHPSYGVPKTYLAEVIGPVPRDLGRQLRSGVVLDDGPAAVDSFRVVQSSGNRVLVELVLHEGRNRLVRRLLEAVGFPVQRLVRVKVGDVALGELRPGRVRPLNQREVAKLFKAVDL